MTKLQKLVSRFRSNPKDFEYRELKRLLESLGYREVQKGRTSGSRVAFVDDKNKHIITFHKPHRSGTPIRQYTLKEIQKALLQRKKLKAIKTRKKNKKEGID